MSSLLSLLVVCLLAAAASARTPPMDGDSDGQGELAGCRLKQHQPRERLLPARGRDRRPPPLGSRRC